MAMTNYHEIPVNYTSFSNYIENKNDILFDSLSKTDTKILFYDTCSFRYHSNLNEKERKAIVDYIKSKKFLLVFITTIVMELGQDSGNYENLYINYFKELYDAKVKMFFVKEEEFYDNAKIVFSSETIKSQLKYGVLNIKRPNSVAEIARERYSDFFYSEKENTSIVISNFFQDVRNTKEHEDDLGEQMILLCVYLLSQIPPLYENRIYVFTDDKGAASLFQKVFNKLPNKCAYPRIFNIIKIVEDLYITNQIVDEIKLKNIISSVYATDNIKIRIAREISSTIDTISITVDELIEEITKKHSYNILL